MPQAAVQSGNDGVGTRIRLLRQRRGLTQEALAGALGVSRSAIALWETGRGGESGHLPGIAGALGVPVEFFLTGMARKETVQTLTMEENTLVEAYRACLPSGRLVLLRAAMRMRRR